MKIVYFIIALFGITCVSAQPAENYVIRLERPNPRLQVAVAINSTQRCWGREPLESKNGFYFTGTLIKDYILESGPSTERFPIAGICYPDQIEFGEREVYEKMGCHYEPLSFQKIGAMYFTGHKNNSGVYSGYYYGGGLPEPASIGQGIYYSDCDDLKTQLINSIKKELDELNNLLEMPNENTYQSRGLGRYAIGRIYTPKLFAGNFNYQYIIDELRHRYLGEDQYDWSYENYIRKMWAMALFDLAADRIQSNIEYENDITSISTSILAEGIPELAMNKELRPEIVRQVLAAFNDILGESRYSPYIVKAEKISHYATVISFFMSQQKNMDRLMKARMIAESIVKYHILYNEILPIVESSSLAEDAILRDVIQSEKSVVDLVLDEQTLQALKDLLANTFGAGLSLYVTPIIIQASGLAGLHGVIAGILIGTCIDAGIYLFQEGETYLFKFNSASLKYTIAKDLNLNDGKNAMVIASSIYIANEDMAKFVVGKLGKEIYFLILIQYNPSNDYIRSEFKADLDETQKWILYLARFNNGTFHDEIQANLDCEAHFKN